MRRRWLEWGQIAVATVLLLLLLWPPRSVYWESFEGVIGRGPTLGVVALVAILVGGVLQRLTTVGRRAFVLGSIIGFCTLAIAIGLVIDPDSPVHLVLYGGLTISLVLGGLIAARWWEVG